MVEGKVVLVTGAAQGIGRYIAHSFGKAGAKLAVADIQSLDNVTRELTEMEADVLPITADVTNEASVKSMIDQVVSHYGRLDVLVNNAGIVPHFQWGVPRWDSIHDMDTAFWNKVLNTNLGGTMLCTKYALGPMRRQGSGHIMGLHGGGGGTGAAAYVVSKDAIKTFMKFVAGEEKDNNICIIAISPGGAIATENAPEEARARMPGPESSGNRWVLAADLPMEFSGHLVELEGDRLVIRE